MKIKELTLFTHQLEKEKAFYHETLGFQFIEVNSDKFSVQIGQTKLIFLASNQRHRYHYCFLIPANQLKESIRWLKERLSIIEIEPGKVVQRFESWNADSVYFYDGSGNIAEFIVRYDLKNDAATEFGLSSVLCVNEIGMPVKNVAAINTQLETQLNSIFWKGDIERFATNGTQEGLFLLPNYEMKKEWFPTNLAVEPSPFSAVIEQENKTYAIKFSNEELTTMIVKN